LTSKGKFYLEKCGKIRENENTKSECGKITSTLFLNDPQKGLF
jgi:hypothetical protein